MRHPDFQKIYQAFMWRYCKGETECELGKSYYYGWLNKLGGLDDTKPYQRPQEKFSWTEPYLKFLKEDEQAKYFRVEALFPLSSMNNNVYTEDELLKGARSLVGKTVNWNHASEIVPEVSIFDAEYEDNCVECVLRVAKGSKTLDLIEKGEVIHVSIEADCLRGTEHTPEGNVCKGLVFTGLALLTKEVLPGVPLTRIMPVERLVQSFTVTQVTNLNDQEKGKQEPQTQNQTAEPGENVVAPQTSQSVGQQGYEIEEYNKASEDTPWNFDASKYDIDQLRMACAVVTGPSGVDGKHVKEDCHLPHHLPGDGKSHGGTLVWHGVAAAGAVLMGAHGGVKISSEDQAKAKSHLEKHYAEFEKKAPWQEDLHMKVLDLENKMASLSEELANRKPREEIFESDLASLKADIEQLKKSQEPHQEPKQEPKEPCKCVLTKEGFWARFHQLRSAGASKSEAFRLVSLEVIEAATKRPKI